MKTRSKNSLLTILAFGLILGFAGLILAATTLNLGSASGFAVLAGSAISDPAGGSVIVGNVGLSPTGGTAITNLRCSDVTGTIYDTNAGYTGGNSPGSIGCLVTNAGLLSTAKSDLSTAYASAVTQATTTLIVADLGGQVLTPGVYANNSSVGLTGTVTLDGQGDPNAVFIIKAGSTLTTAAGSHVTLIGNAQACNVFWQVGSSATLGSGSDFKGNILAAVSITDNGGSTVIGSLFAMNAAVTLNTTHVTKQTCSVTPTPSSPPNSSVGGSNAPLPFIGITKTPNPPVLPSGPGLVQYTYIVKNLGTVPLYGVWVTDNECSPVTFVSGDTNNNSLLDVNEVWAYQCTKMVYQTETDTATTHGAGNGWDAYDTANAMVIVGQNSPPIVQAATPTVSLPVSVVTSTTVTTPFVPKLPSTGFSPEHTNKNPLNSILGFMLRYF